LCMNRTKGLMSSRIGVPARFFRKKEKKIEKICNDCPRKFSLE